MATAAAGAVPRDVHPARIAMALCIGVLCWWGGQHLPFLPNARPDAACRLLFVTGFTTARAAEASTDCPAAETTTV